MTIRRFFTLIVATVHLCAQQHVSLSLPEAEQRAIETSRILRISHSRLQQAELRRSEIATSRLPSMSFQGGYNHLSPVPPFQFTPPFPGAEPVTIAPVILDQTYLRLQFQQVLFAGGRISASEEATMYQAHALSNDYHSDISRVRLAVRTTYWNLFKLRTSLQAFQQTIRQIEARILDVENLKRAGMATANDVLKIRAQLASIRTQMLEVEAQEQSLTISLNNLVGLSLNTRGTLSTEPVGYDSLDNNLDSLIAEALASRPDLAAARSRLHAAKASVDATQSAWYPNIALNASYLYANPNQRFLPNRKQFDGTWDVGINLSWNVWNWLQPSYQVSQACEQYEQSRLNLEIQYDNVIVEVTQNYAALRPARQRIDAAHEALAQAEENYTTTVSRFNAGVSTSTDVLEAESLLLQARINEISARADYMLAQARLMNALGK